MHDAAPAKLALPFHHQMYNYIGNHPFVIVVTLGAPLAGFILNKNLHRPDLTLSQKIMHSRVFAQGGILSIALITMGIKQYIDDKGYYED